MPVSGLVNLWLPSVIMDSGLFHHLALRHYKYNLQQCGVEAGYWSYTGSEAWLERAGPPLMLEVSSGPAQGLGFREQWLIEGWKPQRDTCSEGSAAGWAAADKCHLLGHAAP